MQVKDLKKQYEVIRKDENTNEEFLVWNAKNKYKRYHTNLEDAKYTLEHEKKIWHIDNIFNHKYTWTIRWRWISNWEEVK